jgi:hypothetical protein
VETKYVIVLKMIYFQYKLFMMKMTTITDLPREMISEVFKHITSVKDVVAFASTYRMGRVGMKDSFASLMFDEVQTVSESEYLNNKELYPPNLLFSLNLHCCVVIDVSALGGVRELNLYSCYNVTVISALGGVYNLNLTRCYGVTDVSALGRVHTLNLSFCYNVTDVSALGRVHSLYLTGCHNVTDVSALGGAHSLDLTGCIGVSDVSALGGVHALNLS